MENCTKFGQLILSEIIRTVATICQILRLGPTSKGREGRKWKWKGRRGKGREEEGKGEGGRGEGRGVLDLPLKYMVTLFYSVSQKNPPPEIF